MYKSPITIIESAIDSFQKGLIKEKEDAIIFSVKMHLGVDVDRGELLRALQYDRQQYEKGYADGKADAAPEWISVKDRLPEKDGHYLCNYHFGEYPKMTFTQVLDYYATDIVPHFQHTLGDGSMKVTHWMEIPKLPKPPKGE